MTSAKAASTTRNSAGNDEKTASSSSSDNWSQTAADYARHAQAYTQRYITTAVDDAIAALLEKRSLQEQNGACLQVLDIAAGAGAATFYLLQALSHKVPFSQVTLTATDKSLDMLKQLQAAAPVHMAHYPSATLKVKQMNMEDLSDIATESMHLVTMTFGIMFSEDPVQALREVKRVLAPNGVAILTTWSWTSSVSEMLEAVAAQGKITSPSDVPPLKVMEFGSSLRMQKLCRQAGIRATSVTCRFIQKAEGHPFSCQMLARSINTNPAFKQFAPIDVDQAAAFLAEFADGYNEHGDPYRLCYSTALCTRIGF